MARLDDVITHLKNIRIALDGSVNDFIYGRIEEIDEKKGGLKFPLIHVESIPTVRNISLTNSHLPHRQEYETTISIYDLFHTAERATKTIEQKQAETLELLNQYLAEVKNQVEGQNGINVGYFISGLKSASGQVVDQQLSRGLVKAFYTITVMIDKPECDTLTGDYSAFAVAQITGLSIDVSDGLTAQLSWTNNATNATQINIQRSTDGVDYSIIETIDASLSTYADTPAAGTYFYQVQAINNYADATVSDSVSDTVGFDPDATTFFVAAGITDSTQKAAVSSMVTSLKINSLWTKFHALYPFVGGSALAHAVNLKSPGTYDITWYNSIIHDANGVKGDGISAYGDTGLNVNTVTDLNSMAFGVYVHTDGALVDMGVFEGFNYAFLNSNNAGSNYGFINSADPLGGVISDGLGLNVLSRESSSIAAIYGNGVQTSRETSNTSTIKPNGNVFIHARSNPTVAANFGNRRHSLGFVSTGLIESEVTTLNTIVTTFQTALSRNV